MAQGSQAPRRSTGHPIMESKPIHILNPRDVPPLGARPSADPASLPGGVFKKLQGVRCKGNRLTVRDGHNKLVSTVPVAGASYRGGIYIHHDTYAYLLCAFKVSGEIRFYQLDLASNTWSSELSSASTRFAADAFVDFTVIRYTSTAIALNATVLCLNGTDSPRIVAAGTYATGSWVYFQPTAQNVAQRAVVARAGSGSLKTDSPLDADYTITNSTAHFTLALTAPSAPESNHYTLTADTSVADGDTSTFAIAGTSEPLQIEGEQVWLMVESAYDFWDHVKVELYTTPNVPAGSPTYTTVHDPTTAVYTAGTVDEQVYDGTGTAIANTKLVAFNCSNIGRDTSYLFLIHGFRLTWKGAAPSGAKTAKIYFMRGSGRIQGTTSLAYTYVDIAESAPMFIPTTANTEHYVTNSSGVQLPLPWTSTLYYSYMPSFYEPLLADINAGASSFNLYVKKPGYTDYELCSNEPATSAAWSTGSTFWSPAAAYSYLETDPSSVVPESDMLAIPTGLVSLKTNNRMYVGKDDNLWISDYGENHRFTARVRFLADGSADPVSGTVNNFGGEVVKVLVPIPTQWNNLASVLCITDKSCWLISGADSESLSKPSLIAKIGTIYPRTVSQYKGDVYFVDSDKQVRALINGQMHDISYGKIDDTISAETIGCGFSGRDHYSFSTLQSGDTTYVNTWRFDPAKGEWTSDRMGSGNHAGIIQIPSKALGVSETGTVYWLEKSGQTTDDGTAIPVDIETGDNGYDVFLKAFYSDPGLFTECTAGTLNVSLTTESDTATGTISITTGGWNYSHSTGGTLSNSGRYCRLRFYGTMTAGDKIRAIVLKGRPEYTA